MRLQAARGGANRREAQLVDGRCAAASKSSRSAPIVAWARAAPAPLACLSGQPGGFPASGHRQLEDKFMGLASRVIPQEQAAKIADTVRKLEEVKDLCDLTDLLVSP